MPKLGRPPEKFPRAHQVAVRFSDAEFGALKRAIAVDHPGTDKPTMASWLREVAVAHAGVVLGMVVRRDRVDREGATSFSAWRSAKRASVAAGKKRRRRAG